MAAVLRNVNSSVRLCCAKRQARRLFATRSARLQFEYYKVSCLYKISISLSNTYIRFTNGLIQGSILKSENRGFYYEMIG